MTSRIESAWLSLERWLATNAPDLSLPEGAGADALSRAEEALGQPLPAELRESLLRHDGDYDCGIIGGWSLMSADSIAREARMMADLVDKGTFAQAQGAKHPRIRSTWWNKRWIPFVSSMSGHFFCVDMDPAPGGQRGQVVLFMHDSEDRYLVADSLGDWMDAIVRDLNAGRYDYDGGNWNHALMRSSVEGKDIYG